MLHTAIVAVLIVFIQAEGRFFLGEIEGVYACATPRDPSKLPEEFGKIVIGYHNETDENYNFVSLKAANTFNYQFSTEDKNAGTSYIVMETYCTLGDLPSTPSGTLCMVLPKIQSVKTKFRIHYIIATPTNYCFVSQIAPPGYEQWDQCIEVDCAKARKGNPVKKI